MLLRNFLVFFFLLFSSVCYATDYTQDANCALAWLFTEGSGTSINDATTNNRDATFKGDGEPAWYSTDEPKSYVAYSGDFDGTNDYIYTADFIGSNQAAFSAVAWVYFDTSNTDDFFIFQSNYSNGFFMARDDVGTARTDCFTLRVYRETSSGTVETATNSAASGNWYHVAMTFSSAADEVRGYINGVEDANSPNGTGVGDMVNPSGSLFVGSVGTGAANTMADGRITEVALFADVLTPTEINDILDNGLKPSSTTRRIMIIDG
jgi:hypothetical protein